MAVRSARELNPLDLPCWDECDMEARRKWDGEHHMHQPGGPSTALQGQGRGRATRW